MQAVNGELSFEDRQHWDSQQMHVLDAMNIMRHRFAHRQPLRYSSVTEAVDSCIGGDVTFAREAYRSLYQVVQSINGPQALEEFHMRGRGAFFEELASFAMPYLIPPESLVMPAFETHILWERMYSNKIATAERNGFVYQQRHSPDAAIFQQDTSGDPVISEVVEATLNGDISPGKIISKAERAAYAVMRSQKRGYGLFASDKEVTMTVVVPDVPAVVSNIDHGLSVVGRQHAEKSGERVIAVPYVFEGDRPKEVLVSVRRLILPVDNARLMQSYGRLIHHYRPAAGEPTIAELLDEAERSFIGAGMRIRNSAFL